MFPERLKQLRKSRNLTLPKLAEALNKASGKNGAHNSANQLGNWERGERKPDYLELIKLADFFDVSVDYLVGHINEETIDLLQIMFVNQIQYENKNISQIDKYNIMKLIASYFNKDNENIGRMFDNQTELNLFDDLEQK